MFAPFGTQVAALVEMLAVLLKDGIPLEATMACLGNYLL